MRIPPLAVALLVGASIGVPAGAQTVFLQNDSYGGGALLCYTGITNDRGLGAKFTAAPSQYPYTIQTIRVFGCGGGSDAYAIEIFRDDGDTPAPGIRIWASSNAYLLSGGNTFNDILLSSEAVPPPPITSGSVRVLLVDIKILQPIGFGADLNGIQPHRNTVRDESSNWSFAESPPYNVGGDWIMRLGIDAASVPQLSALDVSVTEGTGGSTDAVFTVALAPAAAQPVTVSYATADGTATSPQDFAAAAGILTFPPGAQVRTVIVPVVADSLDEAEESFTLGLSSPVNAALLDATALGVVTDDDAAPTVSVADAGTLEGDGGTGTLTFPVSLSAPSGLAVTVPFATANGSAIAPGDFTAASGTLTFPAGVAQRPVDVAVVRDLQDEPDESFALNLGTPVNASLSDASGVGTLLDDDSAVQQELAHGSRWTGSLASHPGPAADLDVYALAQAPRSSYEVLVDGASGDLGLAGPVLERYDPATSLVLQASVPIGAGPGRALRWVNASSAAVGTQQIRVRSGQCTADCGVDDAYRIRAYETTVRCARFNNVGTQVTVVQVQNTSAAPVVGTLWFWSAAGALMGQEPLALTPHGATVINTSTLPGLAGQSGSLTLTSDAAYGVVTGKSVALEPATGMSFDAPLEPRPR